MQLTFTDANNNEQSFEVQEGSTIDATINSVDSEYFVSITINGITQEFEVGYVAGGPHIRPRTPR